MVVLRLFLYTSQPPWWYSDYPYAHHSLPIGSDNPYTRHSLPGCTQTIPLLITVSLVALTLSLYSSQYTWWLRPIIILITVYLVVLSLALYSSQIPWWYSEYPFTHHSLSGGPQTIPILITIYLVSQTISILITVSLVVLRLSLYSLQSPLWYSDYPYTHHSLSGGTKTIPILTIVSLLVGHQSIPIHITFCYVVFRLTLYAS